MIEVRRGQRGMFEVLFGMDELADALRKHGWVEVMDIDEQKKVEVHDINGRMTIFAPKTLNSIAVSAETVINLARNGLLVRRPGKAMPLLASIDIERTGQVVIVVDRDEGGRSVTTDILAVVDHLVRNGHIGPDESFVYRDSTQIYDGVQVIDGVFRRFVPLQVLDADSAVRLLREKTLANPMPPRA